VVRRLIIVQQPQRAFWLHFRCSHRNVVYLKVFRFERGIQDNISCQIKNISSIIFDPGGRRLSKVQVYTYIAFGLSIDQALISTSHRIKTMGHRSTKNNNDDERCATHTTICDFSTGRLTDVAGDSYKLYGRPIRSVMEGQRITKEQRPSKRARLSLARVVNGG